MFMAAVQDGSHALIYRSVLKGHAFEACEAAPIALGFAVDFIVIVERTTGAESAVPIGCVWKKLEPIVSAIADREIARHLVRGGQVDHCVFVVEGDTRSDSFDAA